MAKKRRRKGKKEPHPTLFVLDGSIRHFDGGSMLELYSGISPEEWLTIVNETMSYLTFVTCLKEVAFPILKEVWTDEDDWYRLQLEIAVSRMKNIDPLIINQAQYDTLKEQYSRKMTRNAHELIQDVETLRAAKSQLIGKSSIVSDL